MQFIYELLELTTSSPLRVLLAGGMEYLRVGIQHCLMLVGLFVVAVAPAGVKICSNDIDCELLGTCTDGICKCFPGFTGPSCGKLDLLPVSALNHGRVWPPERAPEDQPTAMAVIPYSMHLLHSQTMFRTVAPEKSRNKQPNSKNLTLTP